MTLPRGGAILGIVAVISVALNLFLAGNQLGRHFRGPMQPGNFQERLNGLWRDMPSADQTIAHSIVDSHYNELFEKWRAFRPSNQRAAIAIHADPFDPAEAKAAYDNANRRSEEFRKAMQDMLIDVAQKISPEGRERLHAFGGF